MTTEVSAGGVVFFRSGPDVRVLMIRDIYGHWTLPKGHVEEAESPQNAALREISEETGVHGHLLYPLADIRYAYRTPGGAQQPKVVKFFLVSANDTALNPKTDEVMAAKWVPLEQAEEFCGYGNTRVILRLAAERLGRP